MAVRPPSAIVSDMSNGAIIVLWVYIALLLLGGVMGFVKARSRISLITSAVFAIALALCALRVIPSMPVAHGLVFLLLIVFVIRLVKTKKFMPSGLMTILSAATLLALWWLH